jgi:hypothetical protein
VVYDEKGYRHAIEARRVFAFCGGSLVVHWVVFELLFLLASWQ